MMGRMASKKSGGFPKSPPSGQGKTGPVPTGKKDRKKAPSTADYSNAPKSNPKSGNLGKP